MILDMGPMLRGEVTSIPFDFTLTPEPPHGVAFPEGAHAVGEVRDSAGYMRMSVRLSVPYTGECARCLTPVSGVFRTDAEWTVVTEGTLTEEQLFEGDEEYALIENGKLDVDELLSETVVLMFPTRLLCEENCLGLCPKCGKPRRDGPCGCPEKEPDPRFAVLATLFADEGPDSEKDKK